MARVALIPKHVSMTMTTEEAFDLIVTLRATVRDYGDSLPESMAELLEALISAYPTDLPQPVEVDGGEGDTASV